MSLVIDSSFTVAWIYDDERTVEIDRVLVRVIQQGAYVPAIWKLEVANALQQGIRRGRIDKAMRDGAFADLSALRITVDPETDARAWSESVSLADRFGLTLYDACYLELAGRRSLPLATLDGDLRRAAGECGVTLFGA